MILEKQYFFIFQKIRLKLSLVKVNKQYRLFNNLYNTKQYVTALKEGSKLLEEYPNDSNLLRKIAFCHFEIKEYEYASNNMMTALEKKSHLQLSSIIEYIENNMPVNIIINKPMTEYNYFGGNYNLGMLVHEIIEDNNREKYITKIIAMEYMNKNYIEREHFFNKEIRENFPQLKNLSPKMLQYSEMNKEKLAFLTFKKIENKTLTNNNMFPEIIKISDEIISSIKYDDYFPFQKIRKDNPLSSTMHKLLTHKNILFRLRNQVRNLDDDIFFLIDRLENIIIGLKIYKLVEPEEHYVFIHGDFHKGNVLYDLENKKYQIIDWVYYDVGFKGYDLINYLSSHNLNFNEIKILYFDTIKNDLENSIIRKIFLAYYFIELEIATLSKNNMEEKKINCILPAIEYIEDLAVQLNKMQNQSTISPE